MHVLREQARLRRLHSSLLQTGHAISNKRGDAICRAEDDFQTPGTRGTSSIPQIQCVGSVGIALSYAFSSLPDSSLYKGKLVIPC